MGEVVKREPPNKILTREDELKIVDAYRAGMSPERIRVQVLNCKFKTANSISDALKRLGIFEGDNKLRYSNTKNHNYFSKIDTEKKAYFLGLMQSDGWIHKKSEGSRQVGLCLEELYIIEEFKSELSTSNKIVHRYKDDDNKKDLYQIQLDSVFLYKDLAKFGVGDKFTDQYFPIMDDNLCNHYIRGLFDGDGTNHIAEKTNNLHIGFLGGIKTMSQISFYLAQRLGVYQSQPFKTVGNSVELYGIRYSEKEDTEKIFNFLYNDANIFIKRKKQVFEKWFGENGNNN